MVKVLQINLNHYPAVQDLLLQLVREEKADIVIISEEYRDLDEPNWVRDANDKAAIWICENLHISNKMDPPLPGFTWVEVAGMRLYSCYFPPSDEIDDFARPLDTVVASASTSRLPIMIGGDFNAWATEWGSAKTNERGCMLLEAFATLELEIANKGKTPTYSKGGKTSIVDLTLVNTRLMEEGLAWRVSDRYTGSDHQALVYKLHLTSRTAGMDKLPIKERWAQSSFDREAFLCSLEGAFVEGIAEEKAQSLSRAITAACDGSMSTRSASLLVKRGHCGNTPKVS